MSVNPLTPAAQAAEAATPDDAMLSVMSEFGPLLDPNAEDPAPGAKEEAKVESKPDPRPDAAKAEPPKEEAEAPASRALLKALELDRKAQEAMTRAQEIERTFPAKLEAEAAKVRADLLQQARRDPAGFMKSIGFEKLGDVAQLLYAAELGDKAPEALRKSVKELERDRAARDEFATLRKELEDFKAAQAQSATQAQVAAAVRQYTDTLDAYAKAPTDTSHTYFNRLAKTNPTRATQLMHDAAVEYATQSGGKGNALTPAQAAAAVDKLLADLAVGFKDETPAPAETSKTESQRALTATAVQGRTTVRPSASTDDELTREAMEAAMAVYRGK